MIEINMIAGMGHGTPLGRGVGAPGPYMLDVGISSTREIAHFWGIATTEKSVSTRSQLEVPVGQRRPLSRARVLDMEKAKAEAPEPAGMHLFQHSLASGAPGVKKVIEDALRAAGLMR